MSIEERLFYTRRYTPWLLELALLKKKLSDSVLSESQSQSKEENSPKTQETLFEYNYIRCRDLENIELEGRYVKMIYKSFFALLRLPETVVFSFWSLLTKTP